MKPKFSRNLNERNPMFKTYSDEFTSVKPKSNISLHSRNSKRERGQFRDEIEKIDRKIRERETKLTSLKKRMDDLARKARPDQNPKKADGLQRGKFLEKHKNSRKWDSYKIGQEIEANWEHQNKKSRVQDYGDIPITKSSFTKQKSRNKIQNLKKLVIDDRQQDFKKRLDLRTEDLIFKNSGLKTKNRIEPKKYEDLKKNGVRKTRKKIEENFIFNKKMDDWKVIEDNLISQNYQNKLGLDLSIPGENVMQVSGFDDVITSPYACKRKRSRSRRHLRNKEDPFVSKDSTNLKNTKNITKKNSYKNLNPKKANMSPKKVNPNRTRDKSPIRDLKLNIETNQSLTKGKHWKDNERSHFIQSGLNRKKKEYKEPPKPKKLSIDKLNEKKFNTLYDKKFVKEPEDFDRLDDSHIYDPDSKFNRKLLSSRRNRNILKKDKADVGNIYSNVHQEPALQRWREKRDASIRSRSRVRSNSHTGPNKRLITPRKSRIKNLMKVNLKNSVRKSNVTFEDDEELKLSIQKHIETQSKDKIMSRKASWLKSIINQKEDKLSKSKEKTEIKKLKDVSIEQRGPNNNKPPLNHLRHLKDPNPTLKNQIQKYEEKINQKTSEDESELSSLKNLKLNTKRKRNSNKRKSNKLAFQTPQVFAKEIKKCLIYQKNAEDEEILSNFFTNNSSNSKNDENPSGSKRDNSLERNSVRDQIKDVAETFNRLNKSGAQTNRLRAPLHINKRSSKKILSSKALPQNKESLFKSAHFEQNLVHSNSKISRDKDINANIEIFESKNKMNENEQDNKNHDLNDNGNPKNNTDSKDLHQDLRDKPKKRKFSLIGFISDLF